MSRRLALFALDRAIAEQRPELAPLTLRGFDPLLRVRARRALRNALAAARLSTAVDDPVHHLRLAYLQLARGTPESGFDDTDAIAAEQRALAAGARAPRRGPWLSLALVATVVIAVASVLVLRVVLRPFDPRETKDGRVFAKTLPSLVVALSQGPGAPAGPIDAARAELDAAAPALGPEPAKQLSELTEAAIALSRAAPARAGAPRPELERVNVAAASLNRALSSAGLPYFVDADPWFQPTHTMPILFGFYVEQDAELEAGGQKVRAVHLWRLDDLNLRQGYLGYTRPSTPAALVLLDQIEHDLVEDVLPALPDGAPMTLVDDITELRGAEWATAVGARGGELVRAYFAAVPEGRDPAVQRVGELLARRRALLEAWEKDLAGLGHRLRAPRRLVPEGDYAEALSLRISRKQLYEWDDLHAELLTKDKLAAFTALRDHYVATVERHEVQHRLDYAAGLMPMPPALAELLGVEDPLNVPLGSLPARARDEMSAFMASLVQSGPSPVLELALLSRFVFNGSSLGGPYSYAALAIFVGLARELGIDDRALLGPGRIRRERVAKLFLAVTAKPAAELRAAAARLDRTGFARELPVPKVVSRREHRAWRH